MASIVETFTEADGDSLGSNWTEPQGDIDTVSGNAVVQTTGFVDAYAIHSTSLSGVDQYAKVTSGTADFQYPFIVLRYTNSSSGHYIFYIDGPNGTLDWSYKPSVSGSSSLISASGSLGGQILSSNSVGITLEGTGTNTTVRIWRNPSGDAPTSTSLWGGSSPAVTLTTDPATAVDTGSYIGFGGTQGTAGQIIVTAFSGGDFATASIVPQAMANYRMRAA